MTVRFRTEASSEVVLAKRWCHERRPGLGEDFAQSLEHTIDSISALPQAFPDVAVGLRRALLTRFPYAVYYRVDGDVIDVVACLHTRRSPSRWRVRESDETAGDS